MMKKKLARLLISLVMSDASMDVVEEKEPDTCVEDILEGVKSGRGDVLGFVRGRRSLDCC